MSQTQSIPKDRLVTPMRSAPVATKPVPSRVLLAPWGHVASTNGDFRLDDESARLAVSSFEEHGTDLPIDYEHQTLGGRYASPDGQAPAAGWIKSMSVEAGSGLWADIEWTDQALARLAAKEYRYLSPVAVVRKADRKLVAIHSAALTNKPAIIGMAPIINRDTPDEIEKLRQELNLPENANADETLVAASRRIADLEFESRERRTEQRIAAAEAAGKLVEAQRGWARDLIAQSEALFDSWLESAPTIVLPGATAAPTQNSSREAARHGQEARARSEYRSNPILAELTSEDAFIADALRAA